MELTTRWLDRFLQHPIGKKILEEDEAARLARRAALVGKLKAAETTLVKRLPALEATAREALAAYNKAKSAADDAHSAHARAAAALRAAHHEADRARPTLEAELRASASPLIAAFVESLDQTTDKLRISGPDISAEDGRPEVYMNWDTHPTRKGDMGQALKYSVVFHGGFMERACRVRGQALALAMEALDETELRARLDALSADLGQVEAAA